jgi:hypothetical protein
VNSGSRFQRELFLTDSKAKVTKPFSCPYRLKSRGSVLSGFLAFSLALGMYAELTA